MLCILLADPLNLRFLQPYLGPPAQAVQTVNILLFYHLIILATLGIYLSYGIERVSINCIHIFQTPLIYMVFAGLLLCGFSGSLPYSFLETVDSLLDVTAPLALLIFGLIMGKYIFFLETEEYRGMIPGVLLCCFFRLIFSPVLALLLVKLMGIEDIVLLRGLVLSSGTPTGIFAALILAYYGKPNDKRFVILCILITSILALITIQLLLWIVNQWFPLPEPV